MTASRQDAERVETLLRACFPTRDVTVTRTFDGLKSSSLRYSLHDAYAPLPCGG